MTQGTSLTSFKGILLGMRPAFGLDSYRRAQKIATVLTVMCFLTGVGNECRGQLMESDMEWL